MRFFGDDEEPGSLFDDTVEQEDDEVEVWVHEIDEDDPEPEDAEDEDTEGVEDDDDEGVIEDDGLPDGDVVFKDLRRV